MSIYEIYADQSELVVAKKTITTWLIAADKEINISDREIYDSMFSESDLSDYAKNININNDDLAKSCDIIANNYKESNSEGFDFIQNLIKLAFSNNNIQPYEKVILECLRQVLGIEDIIFLNEFETITQQSFLPIGDVSSKKWWESPEIEAADTVKDYYEFLDISMQASSQEIQVRLQSSSLNISEVDHDNITHILLNSQRRDTYNKVIKYNGIINNIFAYHNQHSDNLIFSLPEKTVTFKVVYLWAVAITIFIFAALNYNYSWIKISMDNEVKPIALMNTISTSTPVKELIVMEKQYKVINTGNLNMRSGPGTEFDSTSVLMKGVVVEVVSESSGWSLVIYKDQKGWMSTFHLASISK
jgi:hypothetical protein